MTAVGYRFRAELRARWRSVAVLALLAGIAGGVTLAAIAGARRTDSAFSRLLTATHAAQVLVNPDFGNDSELDPKAIARLPMVSEVGVGRGLIVVPVPLENVADLDTALSLGSDGHVGYSMARLHVVEGRMPDTTRADEVLVNQRFADHYGVDVGSEFDAVIVTADDFATFEDRDISIPDGITAINRGQFGTRIRLRVTGIGGPPESLVVDEGFEQRATVLGPAFLRQHPRADANFFGVSVRLRHGVADLPAFKRAVQALPHKGAIEFQTTPVTEAKVSRAVRPSVGALTVFALVIALTGLLLVGQAIARQTFLDSIDHPTLRALGFGRVQLVVTTMLRGAVVAVAGAVLAVVIAVVASPLAPIGVARGIEPDPGLSFDGAVLASGFLAVLGAVLALAALPAWWYTRAARFRADEQMSVRPSRLTGWVGASGASAVAGTGVRMALEPGRGRTAVPVRTTIVGAVLAVATVVAALVFASSLDHLVSTPRLYGWSWDVRVENGGDSAASARALHTDVRKAMTASKRVASFSDTVISRVNLDGVTVTALGVAPAKGRVEPTIVSGRAPRAADEVALGAKTLDRIGARISDTVQARPDAGGSPTPLRIVGRVVLPGLGTYPGSDKTALGEGALLTRASLRELGPDFGVGPFLVRLATGTDRTTLTRSLRGLSPDPTAISVIGLERPSDIVSYEHVRSTPLLLAGLLALLAIGTVAHALATAVRRRRRDLALLKTLGFTRRQILGAVAWQATTLAGLALLFGIPVGVIVGRWAWTALADDLGTLAEPIVPVLALVLSVPLVLLVANLVAFVPGRIAARLRPATVLRSE
ncbi:MAG TPA: ABC transporter permease [Acidimicrobiia bacterium]|jgi:hypothetical protein